MKTIYNTRIGTKAQHISNKLKPKLQKAGSYIASFLLFVSPAVSTLAQEPAPQSIAPSKKGDNKAVYDTLPELQSSKGGGCRCPPRFQNTEPRPMPKPPPWRDSDPPPNVEIEVLPSGDTVYIIAAQRMPQEIPEADTASSIDEISKTGFRAFCFDGRIYMKSAEPAQNDSRILLYDVIGRVVKEFRISAGASEASISVSELPTGVYLLYSRLNGQDYRFKVFVE
ncbi:MAG: T9SS type A sorting domain-containing protein [Candidatus Micrarchaeota archaeon]